MAGGEVREILSVRKTCHHWWPDDGRPSRNHEKEINSVNKMNEAGNGLSSRASR